MPQEVKCPKCGGSGWLRVRYFTHKGKKYGPFYYVRHQVNGGWSDCYLGKHLPKELSFTKAENWCPFSCSLSEVHNHLRAKRVSELQFQIPEEFQPRWCKLKGIYCPRAKCERYEECSWYRGARKTAACATPAVPVFHDTKREGVGGLV